MRSGVTERSRKCGSAKAAGARMERKRKNEQGGAGKKVFPFVYLILQFMYILLFLFLLVSSTHIKDEEIQQRYSGEKIKETKGSAHR